MKQIKDIKYFYFLGIGGIGMSALARYFNRLGKFVAGYDKTETTLTNELMQEGIEIHYNDNIENIPKNIIDNKEDSLIVITPAIPDNHSEKQYFIKNNYQLLKRSQLLGLITNQSDTIAVAGTHGKTTTSTIIAHIIKQSNLSCAAFLGGIATNYNSNLLLSDKKGWIVVEADEYDRSFLTLFPTIAVITSMDADHLDIYGDKKFMEESYSLFAQQVKEKGIIIAKKDLQLGKNVKAKIKTYSINSQADYIAENIRIEDGKFIFDFKSDEKTIKDIVFGMPGRHNVENAVAAIAVALTLGIEEEIIKSALHSFKGVKRRFEFHVQTSKKVYVDDYAHHPEELKACISSIKELYNDKKITGIFQPHLYSRTKDFADDFAKSLDTLDECILLDIYPARELPIEGVSSQMILDKMKIKEKKILSKQEVLKYIEKKQPEVLITLGAGDIDQLVEPIKKIYSLN
ncbi:MAG: UDP-N-acetylmuramate--L-alanine ligase [Bacteroidia bacterium]